MQEIGSTLTLTAVIATLLSLVFAVAAFMVQRKGKKNQQKQNVQEQAEREVIDAHQVPHLPSVDQLLNASGLPASAGPVATSAAPPEPPVQPASPPPREMPKPSRDVPTGSFFKKYTPGGEKEEIMQQADENVYTWE